jgi:hypothetical protein
MKITLVASIPEDGDAVVCEGNSTFLVRPPYTRASRVALTPADVQEAITKHGFTAEHATFTNYAELIAHLEKQIERSRADSGIPLPQKLPLVDTLALAPIDVIKEFLERTEKELLPDRKWDQAEDILINILAARNEIELRQAALILCEKLRAAQERSKAWQPHDSRFTTGESEVCRTISQAIKQCQRIFEPAS